MDAVPVRQADQHELQLADAQLVAQGDYQQISINAQTPEQLLAEIETCGARPVTLAEATD